MAKGKMNQVALDAKKDEQVFTKELKQFCLDHDIFFYQFPDRFGAFGRIPVPPAEYLLWGKRGMIIEYKANNDYVFDISCLTPAQRAVFDRFGRKSGGYFVVKHVLKSEDYFMIHCADIVPDFNKRVETHSKVKNTWPLVSPKDILADEVFTDTPKFIHFSKEEVLKSILMYLS